jgi:hypothetical protein
MSWLEAAWWMPLGISLLWVGLTIALLIGTAPLPLWGTVLWRLFAVALLTLGLMLTLRAVFLLWKLWSVGP